MNQAFFEKILVFNDTTVVPEYAKPFVSLMTMTKATKPMIADDDTATTKKQADFWSKMRNQLHIFFEAGFIKAILVEHSGFEPLTSTMRM